MRKSLTILVCVVCVATLISSLCVQVNAKESERNLHVKKRGSKSILNADDYWEKISINKSDFNPKLIEKLLTKIESNEFTGINSILLIHRNKLVVEQYYGGYTRNALHTTRSASKAITSALIGIAIDKGYIANVQVPLLPYFPEYMGKIAHWDNRKGKISIASVLTMTSGIKGNEDAMYPTDDWIKFYFDQPLVASPGEKFSYATSGVVVLGNIITRASKMSVPDFTDKYLFQPLGINQYRWPITNSKGNQGLAMTGGGLNMRPIDMAKFGQLYLNHGIWQGKRLISQQWIDESIKAHAISDLYGEDFGYLWRMIERKVGGQMIRSIEAWGNGGQFIMIFPSLDLVAVFTGENYGKFPEMEQPFIMLDDYIIPALL